MNGIVIAYGFWRFGDHWFYFWVCLVQDLVILVMDREETRFLQSLDVQLSVTRLVDQRYVDFMFVCWFCCFPVRFVGSFSFSPAFQRQDRGEKIQNSLD